MESKYKLVADKSDSESLEACSSDCSDTKETQSIINMEDDKKSQQVLDEVDNCKPAEVHFANEKLNQEKVLQSKNQEGEDKSNRVRIPSKKDEDTAAKKKDGYTDVQNVPNNGPASPPKNNQSNIVPNASRKDSYNPNNDPPKYTSIKIANPAPIGLPKQMKAIPKEPENICIFCLEGGDLIHMCSCSALTHKACALEYIRFPGANNDKCAQCRAKLSYSCDRSTPMKNRYVFLFTFLVLVYIAMFGVSVWLTIKLIPNEMNTFLYVCIVANLSILWPLIVVFICVWGLEASLGPYDRTRSSCNDPGCYWSGDCGGGDCDCCDSGGGDGDACAIVLCVLLLVAILLLMIAATWWLIVSLTKFYKSFALKSKEKITFRDEHRKLNTLGFQKHTVGALVTQQPTVRPRTEIEEV